jgi:hypothetical protein
MQYLRQIKFFILFIVCLVPSMGYAAANISVTTDRNLVVMNESFQIIFESDAAVDGDPDFSPLSKDFQILSTGTSSNMNIVNGRISTTKRWTLTAMAKTNGQLVLPSISFGQDISAPSTVTVARVPASNTGQDNNREVFVEVEATTESPYVQAQVIYTVRLFRSVSTTNAALSDPDITGSQAVIERIDEDSAYEFTRAGKRYAVVERTYAIYPQVSGVIRIEPVVFQAQISQGRRSFFGSPFGNTGRTVVVQSDAIELNVKPIPNTYSGSHWLPAKDVVLVEEWSQNPPRFRVGEPITRTISISANGLMASQLPEIPGWETSDFKSYPDQATLTDDKLNTGITGYRVEKIAMIANKAGQFTIPEIKLPWWNVDTRRMEYVEIPAREITVMPAITDNQTNSAIIQPPSIGDLDLNTSRDNTIEPPQGDDPLLSDPLTRQTTGGPWPWVSAGLLVLWLVTIILWWRSRNKPSADDLHDSRLESLRQIQKQLKSACQRNDAVVVKDLLVQWGRQMWPNQTIISTADVARNTGNRFKKEIEDINNSLYSRGQNQWNGQSFHSVFESEIQSIVKANVVDKGKLEPLFKI